jgi:flagellar motor switch protein FliM
MAKEFLSQDEVDALLRGVTGETEETQEALTDPSGVRPYDLARQERIVRGRMPTLEIINERFARLLRTGLFNLLRRSSEVSVGPVRVVKYNEFIRSLAVPTNINLVQVKPLRGTSLFVFDPNLVFLIIDTMFGGDGRFHTRVEGRDFSQTEQRIIQRLLEMVLEQYKNSWKSVYSVELQYVRSEIHTQFANIATPNEVVVTTTFDIELGNSTTEFHICIPYAMIEPIRDLLFSSMQVDHLEVDRRWLKMLTKQVQIADVELAADLGETTVTLEQIRRMQVGDVIPINIPQTVVAHVGGVPVMECRYGIAKGQYALKVERLLPHDSDKFIQED